MDYRSDPPENPVSYRLKAKSTSTSPRFLSASGGLFSTAPDYVRFCQMLLDGGELDGRRLLSRKSVELMSAPHVDQIPLPFLPGQGFGLGVAVQKANGESGLLGSPGTYGWGGAYNTYFRIDPQEKLIFLLFAQLSPANNLGLQYGFHNAAMQAIADRAATDERSAQSRVSQLRLARLRQATARSNSQSLTGQGRPA